MERNKSLEIKKITSAVNGSKPNSQLAEIVSEDEEDEGIHNKKPVNLEVATKPKAAAKALVPPLKVKGRRPS